MSDTSIITNESLKDGDIHAVENNSYPQRGSCWTRIGANICVGILTLSTLGLLIALIYVLYQQQQTEQSESEE
jgi:hypothetical protein